MRIADFTVNMRGWPPDGLMRHLAADGVNALAIKIATAGLGYLMFLLLARWMTAAEYGKFAIAFSFASLLAPVALRGQHLMVLRYIPQYDGQSRPDLAAGLLRFSHARVITGILATSVVAGLCLFSGAQAAGGPIDAALPGGTALFLGLVLMVPMAAGQYLSHFLRGLGSLNLALLPMDVFWRAAVPGFTALYLGLGNTVAAAPVIVIAALVLAALAAGQIALAGAYQQRAVADRPAVFDTEDWRRAGRGLWSAGIMATAAPQLVTIMIGAFISPAAAGIFFVVHKSAQLLSLPLVATNMVTAPLIPKYWHRGDRGSVRRIWFAAAAAAGLASLIGLGIFAGFGDSILALFGPSFVAGYLPLIILGCGQWMTAMIGPLNTILLQLGNHAAYLRAQLLHLVIILAGLSAAGLADAGTLFATAVILVVAEIARNAYTLSKSMVYLK